MRNPVLKSAAVAAAVTMLALPMFGARGHADFTRYVALGDSYGAGVSNGSVVASHQHWSYPAIVARQAGAIDFQQPLVSEPGISPELQLTSLVGPTIVPKATTNGVPQNLTLPRPYNNLSVPGFRAGDLLTITGAENPPTGAAQFILRGLGTSVQQAIALNPTFISVFIGGNDVLGAILAGSPAALTPIDTFRTNYTTVINTLTTAVPNAGMVTGTIGDLVSLIPFANTVPPVLVNPTTRQPILGPNGQPIPLIAELGDGTVGPLPAGSKVLLSATTAMATGFGIPPGLSTLPNAGRPLPNQLVLTPAEITAIQTRRAEVNTVIREVAQARDIPVFDTDESFEGLATGMRYGGITFTSAFLTGGIFGFDGFHPTDIGYVFLANSMIRTINEAYGTAIPQASLVPLFQNNAPLVQNGEPLLRAEEVEFSPAAMRSLCDVYGGCGSGKVRTKQRRQVTHEQIEITPPVLQ